MKKAKKPVRPVQQDAGGKVHAEKVSGSRFPPAILAFITNTKLQSLIIPVLAILLYSNTLGHQWAQDDTVVITENMFTQKGLQGIRDIFRYDSFYGYFQIEGKADVVSGGRYRPLTIAMFAIVFEFFGANPFAFHLLTVVLFALSCLLLYKTLLLLLDRYKGSGYAEMASWIACVLFVVHPVHTEVVANVKGCDEIVSMIGSLAALYFCLRAFDTGKLVYGIAAGISLFLGLLAKENAVTFLAVIPLSLLFFRKVTIGQAIRNALPIAAAFVLFFIMRSAVLPDLFSEPPMELMNNPYVKWTGEQWIAFTSGEKYATIWYTLGLYIKLLLFPVTLTYDYYPRHIGIMSFSDPAVIGSILFYLLITGYAIWGFLKGKQNLLQYGILFFLITLSIVSNVVFPIGTNMGERFLFLPSIGFCLAIAFLLLSLDDARGKNTTIKSAIALSLLGVVIILFSIKTVDRNKAWYNNKSLVFTDVITSPNSAKVLSVCGMICTTEGVDEKDPARKKELLQQSIEYNTRAIEIHPTYRSAYLNRGVAYLHLGMLDESIADQRKVISVAADYKKGYTNLAAALGAKGKYYEEQLQDLPGALEYFKQSVEADDTNEESTWHLGIVYGRLGDYPQAIKWFKKFTEMRPADPAAWGGLEWAYRLSGDNVRADECKNKAVQLKQ